MGDNWCAFPKIWVELRFGNINDDPKRFKIQNLFYHVLACKKRER